MAPPNLYEPIGEAGIVKMGPFLSVTDGITPVTNLVIAQADVKLSKNNGDFAQKHSNGATPHDARGWYSVELDGTDINANGHLLIAINVAGALPVWRKFQVNVQGG